MNSWLEELVLSLIPPSTKSTETRKLKENFTRRVKHHSYGRTNQFTVAERLTGLEEKFQVLNLDDLAEELYSRRMELNDYEERWLPDVLDLMLHLSHNPATPSRVDDLHNLKPQAETPPVLTWSEIEADDPIDRRDGIWSIPEYSDFSSDEDEVIVKTALVSPESLNQDRMKGPEIERTFIRAGFEDDSSLPSKLRDAQFWQTSAHSVTITSKQAVRETLFMLGGHPTSLFIFSSSGILPNPRFHLQQLEVETSHSLLNELALLGSKIDSVRRWLHVTQSSKVMQLIQSGIGDILADFEREICEEHTDIIHGVSRTGVISILQTLRTVKEESLRLTASLAITSQLKNNDPISALNAIFSTIETAHSSSDLVTLETLFPIFLSAIRSHSKPIDEWLHTGRVDATNPFFIYESSRPRSPSTLWHDRFILSPESDNLTPLFLKMFARQIFTAGKTAAFLRSLGLSAEEDLHESHGLALAAIETVQLTAGSPLPFSVCFEMVFGRHLNSLLASSTATLKEILESRCGLSKTLDAFDHLYLGKNGVILDNLESRMFDQIDRCVEMWNDRFLFTDLLTEAYQEVECVDSDSLSVRSMYTSSRTMESRRRSVKILGAVSVSYHLNRPIANIILPGSMISYQRIALTLSQIRRARSILEHRARFHVQNTPLGPNPNDQRTAQLLHWQLTHFVAVLYAQMTDCIIQPLTRTMRTQLTGSVDDMISVQARYIAALEHACLSSPRIKPLRDALLAILDLCIRFADLVALPTSSSGGRDTDFEANSFTSARSQRRRRRNRQAQQDLDYSTSDDDDDDAMGEGYSTFILDEDTSLMQEMGRIHAEFAKHVSFLHAGLRAVARNSAEEVGDRFELLADALEGAAPRRWNGPTF